MKITDGFENAKIKARITLRDNKALTILRDAVSDKVEASKGKIAEGLDDLYTLLRLLTAYITGEYREISVTSMIAVVAALIYFLNPMDIIPDFVATIGFLDDLTVLAYVVKTFKDEIDKFIAWEMEGKDVEDED
jgi:uncharacterized membrane protein YkvA (DUF1232 family)